MEWNQGPPPRFRHHGTSAGNNSNGANYNNYNNADNVEHGMPHMPGPAMPNGAMPAAPGANNGYGVTSGTAAPSSVYGAIPAQMPCNQMFNVPYTGNMYGATGVPGGLDPRLMGHAFTY